jgi:hypothetical protein
MCNRRTDAVTGPNNSDLEGYIEIVNVHRVQIKNCMTWKLEPFTALHV